MSFLIGFYYCIIAIILQNILGPKQLSKLCYFQENELRVLQRKVKKGKEQFKIHLETEEMWGDKRIISHMLFVPLSYIFGNDNVKFLSYKGVEVVWMVGHGIFWHWESSEEKQKRIHYNFVFVFFIMGRTLRICLAYSCEVVSNVWKRGLYNSWYIFTSI